MGTSARGFAHKDGAYLQQARLHGAEVLLDFMEISITVMHSLGIERGLRHVGLQDVAPIEDRGLRLRGRVQRGYQTPVVEGDIHKSLQLVSLHPRLESPEPRFWLGPLGGLHERIACGDQALEFGPLVGTAPGRLLPESRTST